MSTLVGNILLFVGVMIVVPWGLIWVLRLVGRRRGFGDLYAPELPVRPLAEQPLRCRLRLFHRWRTYQTDSGQRYQRCLDCWRTRDVPTATSFS